MRSERAALADTCHAMPCRQLGEPARLRGDRPALRVVQLAQATPGSARGGPIPTIEAHDSRPGACPAPGPSSASTGGDGLGKRTAPPLRRRTRAAAVQTASCAAPDRGSAASAASAARHRCCAAATGAITRAPVRARRFRSRHARGSLCRGLDPRRGSYSAPIEPGDDSPAWCQLHCPKGRCAHPRRVPH